MNIVIIGGSGFIGPHVVQQLLTQGHDVTLFHRGQTHHHGQMPVRQILGDRQVLMQYAGPLRQLAPQVVLDMIPGTAQDSWTLMQLFHGYAERVVALSSIDVYRAYDRLRRVDAGPPDATPLGEDAPLRTRLFPYRSAAKDGDVAHEYEKILVEHIVLGNAQLPGTVLRLPAVYGPGDQQHRLGWYLRHMDAGRPAILLDAELARWRRSRGYVENVAAAIVRATTMAQARGKIYNVGDDPPLSEAAWVERIGRLVGWTGKLVALDHDRLPPHLQQQLDFGQDWVVSSVHIRDDLGYTETVSLDEGIARSIVWERANPLAERPTPDEYAAEDVALAVQRG